MKVLIVGMNPSSRPTEIKLRKNSTFDRIHRWMDSIGVQYFSFVNCFEEIGEPSMSKVEWDRFKCVDDSYVVLALGGFTSSVLNKARIEHYKLPHPSPRNRLFNDKDYEKKMMRELKKYVKELA